MARPTSKRNTPKLDAASAFLKAELPGWRDDLVVRAAERGIGENALNRAASVLGVERSPRKGRNSAWWTSPSSIDLVLTCPSPTVPDGTGSSPLWRAAASIGELERLAYMHNPRTFELVTLAIDLAEAEESDDALDTEVLERVAGELHESLEAALNNTGSMSRWSKLKLEEWLKARLDQVRELQDLLGAEPGRDQRTP